MGRSRWNTKLMVAKKESPPAGQMVELAAEVIRDRAAGPRGATGRGRKAPQTQRSAKSRRSRPRSLRPLIRSDLSRMELWDPGQIWSISRHDRAVAPTRVDDPTKFGVRGFSNVDG